MAAHLRDIHIYKCRWNLCTSRATKELRNTHNGIVNEYCGKHATMALRDFKRAAGGEEGDDYAY